MANCVQLSLHPRKTNRAMKVALVFLAVLLGIFEPVSQNVSAAANSRPPSRGSRQKQAFQVLRVGHNFSDHYPNTTRVRKPYSGLNGPRKFAVTAGRCINSKIEAMSAAKQTRRSSLLYLTMDHPASSPARWRC